ncbi:MAG: translation elongation factor Ts [Patescibacteria group bacterium]
MTISAKDVMALREKTGLSMMECKKALMEAGGDEEKGMAILKKRGLDKAAKKAERITGSGLIEAYSHDGRIGVLLEVLCETDFVARNEEFKQLAHDLALQVAAMNPLYTSPSHIPQEIVEERKREFAEEARTQGKPEAVVTKIVEGKLDRYCAEVCLLNQPFIKDQDKTAGDIVRSMIAKLGENITVSRFVRYVLGSYE